MEMSRSTISRPLCEAVSVMYLILSTSFSLAGVYGGVGRKRA